MCGVPLLRHHRWKGLRGQARIERRYVPFYLVVVSHTIHAQYCFSVCVLIECIFARAEDVDISVLQNGGRSLSPWLTMERAGKGASTFVVLYGTPDFADIGILSLEVEHVGTQR